MDDNENGMNMDRRNFFRVCERWTRGLRVSR